MAFVAPAFLILIFLIIEVALWMHARNAVLAAAREGVSQLRTADPDASGKWQSFIEATSVKYARELGAVQSPTATADYDEGSRRVTVTVSGGIVDLIPGWDLTVSASSSGLIEVFHPDLGQQ